MNKADKAVKSPCLMLINDQIGKAETSLTASYRYSSILDLFRKACTVSCYPQPKFYCHLRELECKSREDFFQSILHSELAATLNISYITARRQVGGRNPL